MPPAKDTNNRDLVGGRTTGLAAGAELRKVHVSSGSWLLGACASPEPEKLYFNRIGQILGRFSPGRNCGHTKGHQIMSQQTHPQLPVWSWETLGDGSEGSLSWLVLQEGKRRQDPWRAIPDGLLGLSPTLSREGGGHGQAKVLRSSPRMSTHGRKPHAICQRQLGEAPVNVLPSERSFCSPFQVSHHLEWCL